MTENRPKKQKKKKNRQKKTLETCKEFEKTNKTRCER